MTVAGYVRVSSDAQDHATQRHAIEDAARHRGDKVEPWYAEKVSGGTLARPELRRLRADVAARRVRRLYVYSLDRLTRTGILDTFTLVEELRGRGCDLVTVADPFDLAGPAAEVIIAVMAWAAKEERRRINARLAAARARLEAQGRSWGRPSRLTSRERAAIAERRARGESLRTIAQALRVPRATVARAVSKAPPAPGARDVRREEPQGAPSR